MNILQVKKYNDQQFTKWDKACKQWHYGMGGFPQIDFYCFFTNQGAYRQTGYVAFEDHSAYWFKTRTEAEEFRIKRETELYRTKIGKR